MVDDKQSCSPENLRGVADELRRLADQIEAGQVMVGGVTLSICNAVSLKMKQKLVGGQVEFDVNLVASLMGGGSSQVAKPLSPKKTKVAPGKTPKTSKKLRPYEVKKMKKVISQQWKQISNAIATAKTPDPVLQADFLKICEKYGQTAEDEWRPLWQESLATMKQLFELAQEGNFQEASLLLAAVNNQKKSCHKEYK